MCIRDRIRALSRTLRYWSADERNTGLPAIAGYILANRVLWTCVAALLFAATFALFKTERTGTSKSRWARKTKTATQALHAAPRLSTPVTVPRVTPVFGAKTYWHQFAKQLRFDTLGVLKSVPFLVMLAFGMANFIPSALFNQNMYDTGIYPVTSQMLSALQNSFSFLLVFICLLYTSSCRRAPARPAPAFASATTPCPAGSTFMAVTNGARQLPAVPTHLTRWSSARARWARWRPLHKDWRAS